MNGKGAPANRSADVLRASKRSQEQRVAAEPYDAAPLYTGKALASP